MISASQLTRIAACPASEAFAHAREETPQANRGTVVHRFLEDCTKLGRDRALDAVPEEYRGLCEVIDLARLPVNSDAFAAEVAFAFDVATGMARELGRGRNRQYGELTPTEIPGTCDIIGIGADEVYIADAKTGSATPARANKQLRFLALAACRAYGRDRATVELLYLRPDGSVWQDRATLDAFDLDEFALELRSIVAWVADAKALVKEGGIPQTMQGSHCRYCPAFSACPSQTALVRVMATTPDQLDAEIRAALTPQTAALAYERLKVAELVIDRVRKAVYAFAEQQPIELPNGAVLGPVETKREYLDGPVVRDVLRELATPEIADAACEVESSKAAVQRALKPFAEAMGQPLAPMMQKVLAAVREAGGVEVRVTQSVKEHAPKQGKREAA